MAKYEVSYMGTVSVAEERVEPCYVGKRNVYFPGRINNRHAMGESNFSQHVPSGPFF